MPPFFAPPVPDEHFAALGRVANAWAGLEHMIDVVSAHLVGADLEACLCLTAQVIGPARKLDAMLSLMKLRDVEASIIKEAKTLTGKIISLGEARNRALHDPWEQRGVSDAGYFESDFFGLFKGLKFAKAHAPHRHEVTARKTLVREFKRVDTKDLKILEQKIEARKTDLLRIAFTAAVIEWMKKNEPGFDPLKVMDQNQEPVQV